MIIFCFYYLIILLNNFIYSQEVYQSLTIISEQGTQFSPVELSAQLISTSFLDSWNLCTSACNINTLCRIFDYGAIVSQQCRLFEGNIDTLGSIVPSSMANSVVGTIQLTPSLFTEYGQTCTTQCRESRYLMCSSKSVCECMPHTYWNALVGMCVAQSPILGASCEQNMNMCREDLNYTCLQFNQCGPLSLLEGTTIADGSTIIYGSSIAGIGNPYGIALYENKEESLVILDNTNARVLYLQDIESTQMNATFIAHEWGNGNSFSSPFFLILDPRNPTNVYVSNTGYHDVVLVYSMQTVSPIPKIVAGITGVAGSTLDELNYPRGLALDSHGNLYVADQMNHRVMLWTPNATSGIVVIGQGVPGTDSMSLYNPKGIFLDENNSLLYVADGDNQRIQLFRLNETFPLSGTTVAGGNGPGSGSHQLNNPRAVWVSKKTGDMYIVDGSNHRIQKWKQGATTGVTLAGSPYAIAGFDATKLNNPYRCILNSDETRMYVSDAFNSRIQRFNLI